MTTGVKSLDDAGSVVAQLERALDEMGVSLGRPKVQELVAHLCGVRHYADLHYRLKNDPESERDVPIAEMRLLTLPELLMLRRADDGGPVVGHLEFFLKDSSTHWRYIVASASIRPAALEAARRLALGEGLRRGDTKWLSGSSCKASVIDDEKAADALNIDAQALAGAIYLGEGKWQIGARYHCQLSGNYPILIEHHGVPVSEGAIAHEEFSARQFIPPPGFAAAGFEIFTVNIRSRLMLRCLELQDQALVLECLRLIGEYCSLESSLTGMAPRQLLAVLMRVEPGGCARVISVTGLQGRLMAGMRWQGMEANGTNGSAMVNPGEGHGAGGGRTGYSGEIGLCRIWEEIRDWVARCESPAKARLAPTTAEAPLSASRLAELKKWMSRGGEPEQRPDTSAIRVADGSQ